MKQEYDFSEAVRGRFFREGAKVSLPTSDRESGWVGPSGPIGKFIVREAQNSLNAYREQPELITEHARSELDTAQGGYAHRQIAELVQNSADALLGSQKGRSILIRLANGFLYCADDGKAIDEDGVKGLMFDRMGTKRNTRAIGRFGRGFKSVLRVTDAPEFYSRSGSFRFDKKRAKKRIAEFESAGHYPVLRLPEPVEPNGDKADEDLREMMRWATNVVRLPLKPGAHDDLVQQMRDFPPEFLLFVDHVRYLTLEDGEISRAFMLHQKDGELLVDTGQEVTRWRLFDIKHRLTEEARDDWHLHDEGDEVPLRWAAPLDRLDRPGRFWAFLPTETNSLVAGALNAPWKTNEDRQNLLPGPYNEELIEAAAAMIAEALPQLATDDDPARHLDALPRRRGGDESRQADLLRTNLFSGLEGREVVPDQDGALRLIGKISYPPEELTSGSDSEPLDLWAAFPGRPRDWLHHKALTRNRLAAINRLFPTRWTGDGPQSAPRARLAEWLEALVEGSKDSDAVQASKAAIRTAAAIPVQKRGNEPLGRIVLRQDGSWGTPNPEKLFLPEPDLDGAHGEVTYVHAELAGDSKTASALKALGLKVPSAESAFRLAVKRVMEASGSASDDALHKKVWIASRRLPDESSLAFIREHRDWNGQELWRSKLRVLTRSGTWSPVYSVLLPGEVVPGDGSRDDGVTVDTRFHEPDGKLLRSLGVNEVPLDQLELSAEPAYDDFLQRCREQFTSRALERNPHSYRLVFKSSLGCGPLDVLRRLSDEGRAAYTHALLALDGVFSRWTMHHATQEYPELSCESLSTRVLRREGRIRTLSGAIVPVSDALGSTPNPEALQVLLTHPRAAKIKETLDLAEPTPELLGEGDPIPLTDAWPGLEQHLPAHRKHCRIVPCERIIVLGKPRECVFFAPDVYVTGAVDDDERRLLHLILDELRLSLGLGLVEAILQRRTPAEVEQRRRMVRECSNDADRLEAAVGEDRLRKRLPKSLLSVLEKDSVSLAGAEMAEAAIATYHTDALRQYRWALGHLDPPLRWAGSPRAVRFVRELGFSAEWAGERNRRLDPFLEVEGRYRLPELHGYQEVVVRNVRELLCGGRSEDTARRGLVSMPTGSGKTRVAVQAIIEAMRDDGFVGGVLWVADRSELCEQAVESWRQVWSSIGPHEAHLRVSRMWDGQPKPLPTSELHVVVATIQTLNARLSNRHADYDFLRDFRLVVFDEAHRSIAPTFTSVMEEVGLTRRRDTGEPFLLGLSATPYRGYNEEETRWLANRYGGKRLDAGAFENDDAQDVIRELQSKGVLAQADHETIEGETFSLDDVLEGSPQAENWPEELEKWRELPWLPSRVEDRIARSVERTKRILDACIASVDPDWPTLVFATSVEHAQTVAALFNRRGIRSRAVSGATETATRRRVVEEFRRGEVKVLVNHSVFREGFDAPKTRAIVVARPVYSPNLYFQMIGRGLRGPRNGGDERCLILNVQDNIENFDRSLAFSELDWLWARAS